MIRRAIRTADAVALFKEITVDVAKKSLMKMTDICWITPLRNWDISWITLYRLLLAYPPAAADAAGGHQMGSPNRVWPLIIAHSILAICQENRIGHISPNKAL
jgi:hypothetical protein